MKRGAILVCFAVKEEASPFTSFAAHRPEIRTCITGMGQENARRSLEEALAGEPPRVVLSCGFAGGLRPGLASGTVVCSADGHPELRRVLEQAGARAVAFHGASRVVVSAREKMELWEKSGADAVEMESGAITAACRQRGIPCAIVRVILDPAEEDLPIDFNRVLTPSQEMDYGKLAKTLAAAPWKLRGLLSLQRQSKAAARSLAAMIETVLESLCQSS